MEKQEIGRTLFWAGLALYGVSWFIPWVTYDIHRTGDSGNFSWAGSAFGWAALALTMVAETARSHNKTIAWISAVSAVILIWTLIADPSTMVSATTHPAETGAKRQMGMFVGLGGAVLVAASMAWPRPKLNA